MNAQRSLEWEVAWVARKHLDLFDLFVCSNQTLVHEVKLEEKSFGQLESEVISRGNVKSHQDSGSMSETAQWSCKKKQLQFGSW